jgi:hypothetical protein
MSADGSGVGSGVGSAGRSAVTIVWMMLCESAFRDATDRINLLGVATHMPVLSLPLVLHEHVLVARLSERWAGPDLDVGFGVVTPGGLWIAPQAADTSMVDLAGEYLIVTLRSLPLREEGVHRFELALGNGAEAAVEIPVWVCQPATQSTRVH